MKGGLHNPKKNLWINFLHMFKKKIIKSCANPPYRDFLQFDFCPTENFNQFSSKNSDIFFSMLNITNDKVWQQKKYIIFFSSSFHKNNIWAFLPYSAMYLKKNTCWQRKRIIINFLQIPHLQYVFCVTAFFLLNSTHLMFCIFNLQLYCVPSFVCKRLSAVL